MQSFRKFILPIFLFTALLPSVVQAWSHQGHILLTRLAALRIIHDPTAPAELKTFLKTNMPYTLDDCRNLAINDYLGADPTGQNNEGLDGAATFPDRVIQMENGKDLIAPYNVAEGKLHYLDLEFFSSAGEYKNDFSGLPKLNEIPRNLNDPRYKLAGFVAFRIEDVYGRLVQAFGAGDKSFDQQSAVKWLGYTVHYAQDIHQPQHASVDYKSLSYLTEAKIPGVRTITREISGGRTIRQYQVDREKSKEINPHGDVEFQLFENTQEPRAAFRVQFWELLQQQLQVQQNSLPATIAHADKTSPYDIALLVLMDSYRNLPLIGHAAQGAYKSGSFDPAAFFPFKENGEGPSILEMIARQNARAVLLSEILIRRAWAEARSQ